MRSRTFEQMYKGVPPWEIDGPQGEIVHLAHFLVLDALIFRELERRFNTVIDSGFFRALPDKKRPVFVRSLASVLNPAGS